MVSSKPGEGSTFTFTAVFEIDVDREKERSRYIAPERLRGNVLIVDDNDIARISLEEQVKAFQFNVTTVESGIAALEEIKHKGIDYYRLILLDWQMPGLDEVETARRIKKYFRGFRIPIIIMVTAYGYESVAREAKKWALIIFALNR
ncbi:MAG: response regulator [Spirochaetes bacterium]|nr:response regulator [Spirochaetota bacterium]